MVQRSLALFPVYLMLGVSCVTLILWWTRVLPAMIFLLSHFLLPYQLHQRIVRLLPDPAKPRLTEVEMAFEENPDEPQSSAAYVELGDQWKLHEGESKRGFEQAVVCYTKAILLDACNLEAYRARAQLLSNAGRNEEALQDASAAIMINEADPDGYSIRASVHQRLQNFDQALSDIGAAIELSSQPEYFAQRAGIRMDQQDYQEAIADYSTAMDRSGGESWIYWYAYRGTLLVEESREYERGLKDLDRFIEVCGPTEEVLRVRAKALEALGATREARRDLQRANRLEAAQE